VLLRLARREKGLARWDEARALWEAAMRSELGFDPQPWEELAKLYEHRHRDLGAAYAVVGDALSRARAHRAAPRVVGALEHRLERLTRRLARLTCAPPVAPRD
jgi:hypothetical protein